MNHLILTFKRYIYLKKNDRNKRNIFSLRAFTKNIESIERHIASQNGKIEIPLQKMDKAYTSIMNCLTNKMHMFEDHFRCLRGGGRDNGERGTGFLFFLLKKQCVITAM